MASTGQAAPEAPAPGPAAAPGPATPPTQFGYADARTVALARVGFTGPQKYLGLAALALVMAAALWFALTSQPASTARPDLFGGSIVLSNGSRDNPTVVDLATGNPTLIVTVGEPFGFPLSESKDQRANLRYIRSDAGDFVVNRTNGDTNLLRTDHLVVNKRRPYKLPAPADGAGEVEGVTAKAMGSRLFLVRHTGSATDVVLLDQDTIRAAGPDDAAQPRGIALDVRSANLDSSSAVAADSLWLLVEQEGGGGRELRRIREAEKADDLLLRADAAGTFGARSQVAAVGDLVLVVDADAASLTVVDGRDPAKRRTVGLPTLAGAQNVIVAEPASGVATSSLWLAAFVDGGWKVVGADVASVAAGGDGAVRGPFPLPVSAGADQLARPVVNGGSLYAASRSDGSIVRLLLDAGTPGELPGGPTYPDPPDADGERELARNPDAYGAVELASIGPRVTVNVPFAKRALLFETDAGTRKEIVKTEAPELDPTAPPIPGNKRQDNDPNASTTSTTAPVPGQASTTTSSIQVQQDLPCEERDQQPRKAQISDDYLPSAKEVRIEWTYNPQDPRDCFPSRYRIEVEAGTGNSSPPPEPIWVTSTGTRHAAVVGGLRPNRQWRIVVVSALGQRETPSDPLDVETADTGPDPARNPTVDNSREAGWNLAWEACQGDECDRVASEWEIAVDATVCDNRFPIAALPPKLTVGGRNRGRFVSLDELPPDFVGAKVRFGIVGVDGSLRSEATVWTECSEGWRAPTAPIAFRTFVEPTGTTFRIGGTVDPAALDPRVVGSQNVLLLWTIDNASTGPPSTTLRVAKEGVPPQTDHTISVQISHHGRTSPATELRVRTDALPWTTPVVSLTAVERLSTDGHMAEFDVGRTNISFTNVPTGDFTGTATVRCGVAVVASSPFTISGPAATLAPIQWDLRGNSTECTVAVTLSEVVAPGSAPRYSADAVTNTGQWPALPVTGVLPPPRATITVVGWEAAPVDGTSIYDASGYWRWDGTPPAPPDPAVGQWVDNGLVTIQYDVGIVRPDTRISISGNPSPECTLVPAAPTGEWKVPGRCFALNADGITPTDTAVTVITTYFGLPNLSMLDAPVVINDTPRLPKPTDPPT